MSITSSIISIIISVFIVRITSIVKVTLIIRITTVIVATTIVIIIVIIVIPMIIVHKPVLYYRFIDDIVLASPKQIDLQLFKSQFLNLNLNVVHDETINFLDLTIQYDKITGKFIFSLFTQPTGTVSSLLAISNHPNWIFDNIPKSILIRIRRNCSSLVDYYFHARNVIFQLLKQKYNRNKLFSIMLNIGRKSRKELLPYKKSKINKSSSNAIWFNVEFNNNAKSLCNVITNSFNSTKIKFDWMQTLKFKIYNTISPSIGAISIFGKRLSTPKRYFTRPCNMLNCITCDYIYEGSFFKLKNNFIIPFLKNGNCVSSNCIYVIKCTQCGLFYIGQTGQLLKKRMKQHLRAIKLFRPYLKPTTEVGYHFNLKSLPTKEHFQIAIFNSDIHDSKED
jgi:hypothetical protein